MLRLLPMLCVLLLLGIIPWVGYNQARPVVGPRSILTMSREDQYFANQPGSRSAYLGAIGFLHECGCAQIGFLAMTGNEWEYPLWALSAGMVEIQHVGVTNVSATRAAVPNGRLEPCVVFSLGSNSRGASIELNGRTYYSSWTEGQVSVLTVDGR